MLSVPLSPVRVALAKQTQKADSETPLMRQWREVKAKNQDSLVFFRVGDFYELFFGDAEEGSRILGLTLTSRNNGGASRVPLAGIPVKALDEYLVRLVQAGRRVAICEQVEDPAEAQGIVRREVVETVTPGTVLADRLLEAKRNNFIVAVVEGAERVGLAAMDVSTGELILSEVPSSELGGELERIEPRELFLPESGGVGRDIVPSVIRTVRADWLFDTDTARDELERRYHVQTLDGLGFEPGDELMVRAAGALMAYVEEIRPGSGGHLRAPKIQRTGSVMALDSMTRRNLELVEPLRPYDGDASLLAVLDETCTPMGARLLRTWILRPLLDQPEIWERQDAVGELLEKPDERRQLRTALKDIRDLDRLGAKVSTGRASPRDLQALGRSIERLPALQAVEASLSSSALSQLLSQLDGLEETGLLIGKAIAETPPAAVSDGGVIREGYHEELDDLRSVRDGARDFIVGLQVRERENTGISSLKVGFNKVFGYYLEVTKANVSKVPEHFIRKQTLTGAERYFTPELKEWEEKVFDAEDRMGKLESSLFLEVRAQIAGVVPQMQAISVRIAELDVLASFSESAEVRGYVRPTVTGEFAMEIVAGRHPVVETMMPRSEFIPNDLVLDEEGRIAILTGPNMAGKSTVLRQVGLIQLMAQIGSFVPANSARLAICDRIFTRVGASDSLARGQSTFMVEMNETAAIVHGATDKSLVLLDEIGRGTSTYDGVSIAWAVTEHLHEAIGAKAIFATHYHELTQLGDLLKSVKNLNVLVRESGESIVFLRRLEEGGADRSYGIQVARLAGLPPSIIARAMELLAELEGTHSGGGRGLGRSGSTPPEPGDSGQISFFTVESPVVDKLRNLELDRMTPLEALNVLHSLRGDVLGNRGE